MYSPRPNRPMMQLASLKVAAWLLSLTLSFAATAANESCAEAERDGRPAVAGQANRIDGLRTQLALDEGQDALFKLAFAATENLREEMHEAMRARHQQLQARLAAPSPDLRALAAEADQEKAALDAKRKTVREAWLNFYDALRPEQKDVAGKFLLTQIGLMEQAAPGRLRHPAHHHDPASAGAVPRQP